MKRADPNLTTLGGYTALHRASKGHAETWLSSEVWVLGLVFGVWGLALGP